MKTEVTFQWVTLDSASPLPSSVSSTFLVLDEWTCSTWKKTRIGDEITLRRFVGDLHDAAEEGPCVSVGRRRGWCHESQFCETKTSDSQLCFACEQHKQVSSSASVPASSSHDHQRLTQKGQKINDEIEGCLPVGDDS